MTAGPGHPRLRALVAAALASYLRRVPQVEVARILGCADTTVYRRGDDLRAWPADDLLSLAGHDVNLAEALARCASGTAEPAGEPTRVLGELFEGLRASGERTAHIASVVADGQVSGAEARQVRERILRERRAEDRLLRDLAAIERREGGR
jgi:hypothetical protein